MEKRFFEIVFSIPRNTLADIFGHAAWIAWINNYKQSPEPFNPHHKEKPHSNVAWLLQTTEVSIMREIWTKLVESNIPFLSVHDEIIVPVTKVDLALQVMVEVFSNIFTYFKISSEGKVLFEATLAAPATLDQSENHPEFLELPADVTPSDPIGQVNDHPKLDPIQEDKYFVLVFKFLQSIPTGETSLIGLDEESRPCFMKAANHYNGIWPVLQISDNFIIKSVSISEYYPEYENTS